MTNGLRLMHVHAHPDDESSKGAASTARYVQEGVDVHVVTCTGGEEGSVLNPRLDRPEVWENMTEIRRGEMDAAREILGVRQDWLGFRDSGWPEGDPPPPMVAGCFATRDVAEAARPLIRLIRSFKPHVVTTYDENGGYPHPDHIMCHKVSMHAWLYAGDDTYEPELGPAWQPLKIYYQHGFNRPRTQAIHDLCLARGVESPWAERLEKWEPNPEHDARITTQVPCGEFFDVRDKALMAHATQIDPDGHWFAVPLDIQREAWPTEDFELVDAVIDSVLDTGEPEYDLFAGVRELADTYDGVAPRRPSFVAVDGCA